MCLDRIDPAVSKKFKRNKRGDVIAYRFFRAAQRGALHCALWHGRAVRQESAWLTDKDGQVVKDHGGEYPRGFHAFATPTCAFDAALNVHVVRRVLLRGIMTFGEQWDMPAVAASEMFICKGDLK